MKEAEIIAQLAKIFAIPQSERANSRIIVGIGDDGAVVAPSPHNWVITTDMAVEGVHFQQGWSSAYEIGGKITSANLADIFAMGATPHHLVVALSLTGNESMNWISELAMGMNEEAQCTITTQLTHTACHVLRTSRKNWPAVQRSCWWRTISVYQDRWPRCATGAMRAV